MPDPRVNAYIEAAPDYAKPILLHLRSLVHKAHPSAEESMKWSRPSFLFGGHIVCGMSAFKEHCSFGFWGSGMAGVLAEAGIKGEEAAGSLGRIASLKDLPKDKVLLGLIKTAFSMAGGEGGKLKRPSAKQPKAPTQTPTDLSAALAKTGAEERFDAMSPSCRREYIEWIESAKRPETRAKRVGEAVGWIAQGKKRNWKYENC